MKTGGNIAPVKRKKSRRLQALVSARSIFAGARREMIFWPSKMGMSATPINASRPRPMKCQMKMAETANFGIIRSQPARDILAAMIATRPSNIATMKIETTIRPA